MFAPKLFKPNPCSGRLGPMETPIAHQDPRKRPVVTGRNGLHCASPESSMPLMCWRLLIWPWRTIEVPTGDFDGTPATTTLEQGQARWPEGSPQAA